jgi:hypothetical protein
LAGKTHSAAVFYLSGAMRGLSATALPTAISTMDDIDQLSELSSPFVDIVMRSGVSSKKRMVFIPIQIL